MDFAKILEQWEREQRSAMEARRPAREVSSSPGARDEGEAQSGPPAAKSAQPVARPGQAEASRAQAARGPATGPRPGPPCPPAARPAAHVATEVWLDAHGTSDKDALGDAGDPRSGQRAAAAEARRFEALRPQASIDLHGMTAREAEEALGHFLADAAQRGLEKVLVIHGKGYHSAGEPVLGRTARRVIESSPWAGRYGQADRSEGGSGALWVAVRRRQRP